jgi:hypothetical protein
MRDDLRFARQLERAILAAVAEDRCEQLDLPGLIDDLATTYDDIVARLRRMQRQLVVAHGSYLMMPPPQLEQHLIEERITP